MRTPKQKRVGQFQSAPTIHTPKLPPTPEQIRQRAHEVYLARGGAAGRELDDWLQAEWELQAGKNPFSPIKAMSYYLISTDRCVFLTCEGISSLDEMTAAWREVRDELAEKRLNRVLVDVTALRTSPTTAELFDLAKLFWRHSPQGGRIALAVRWDQSRLAKLLEMLVRTLGMWLTAFVSEEQAEAWVLEGTQNEQAVEAFAQ